MKLAVLFSGGKDSTYAAYIAKQLNHELSCLISVESENPESYMFHTPSISLTKKQAELMDIPIISQKTKGKKETELGDLKKAIKKAVDKFQIRGVATGAVQSTYQATRIQKICNKLKIECFNPLWQKDQIELLEELGKNNFEAIITGVFAFPFDESWIGKSLNQETINILKKLNQELQINPAGEGGEFESIVVNCPLFSSPLKIKDIKISGEGHSFRGEVSLQ